MAGQGLEFTKIGMVGTGSMGAALCLLFAENKYTVSFYDPSDENAEKLLQDAKNLGFDTRISRCATHEEICHNTRESNKPGVFFFSTPHGSVIDETIKRLRPHLKSGDIIIDGANEVYERTERRQQELEPHGIHLIGCGVSGGYQSARLAPSIIPGGKTDVLESLMPFFNKVAAKDKQGRPCTAAVGPGGSGHYIKTIHNGIEQGMMSVISEVWFILTQACGLNYEEVSEIFRSWEEQGPLHDSFLIRIGIDINKTKDENGVYVLETVRDKVVQDVDETEGTGNWACLEAITLHSPAATLVAGHLFRYASAYAANRAADEKAARGHSNGPKQIQPASKEQFIAALRAVTYFGFLASFIQGLSVLRKRDVDRKWNLDYRKVLQLWRGGCIIQSDGIIDLLDEMYSRKDHNPDDILSNEEVASVFSEHYPETREVVLRSIEADLYIPAISQSLEYYKYSTSTALPTQFMEAQLDYFGEHMYDTWADPPGSPRTGSHHFEWKPAKGPIEGL